MQYIANKVIRRIISKGRGSVFVPKDFLDIGRRAAVDQALSRLVKAGTIRRLRWGVYDYPRRHSRLGILSPSPDHVAKAIADRDGSKLQVSGARAANMLGLSTQVPAKYVYLTDGSTKDITLGNRTVSLRRAAPSNLIGAGQTSGMVFQALRYLGKSGVDDHAISTLRRKLSPSDKTALGKVAKDMPIWMQDVVAQVRQAA